MGNRRLRVCVREREEERREEGRGGRETNAEANIDSIGEIRR